MKKINKNLKTKIKKNIDIFKTKELEKKLAKFFFSSIFSNEK